MSSGARINPPRCQIWVALRPDSRSKVEAGEGETSWVFMFGHLRFCFAAFLVAGLSITPASSNPLTDLFSGGSKDASAPASKEAAAPAPAQQECLAHPGKPAADGQRWVYHFDGRRRCWFQTAMGAPRRSAHHYVVKQRVTSHERREAALPKADADARAEVLRAAPAQMSQPTSSSPEQLKVADAAPAAPTIEPPAPVAEAATDQRTPDHPTPRVVRVEMLRVSPAADDTIGSSVPPATPVAFHPAETDDDGWGWTASRLGLLLMALGFVALLGASLPMLIGLFSRSGQRVEGRFARE